MADDSVVTLKVDGQVYKVDMDDLALDEVGQIEDLTGKSVGEIDWGSARGMQGMLWLAMHRRDPRVTLEEAGRIKFSAFQEPEETEVKRPTKAASASKSGGSS